MAFGKRNAPPAGVVGAAPAIFRKPGIGQMAVSAVASAAAPAPRVAPMLEPVRPAPLEEPPGFGSTIDVKLVMNASGELLLAMMEAYRDERGCHLETLIGALAALAGEFCLRAGAAAANHTLSAGRQFVLGGVGDPYIYGDGCESKLHIWGLVSTAAVNAGAPPAALPDMRALVARAVAAIGEGAPYPPRPQIPEANLPHEWSPNACPRHRQTVLDVSAASGILAPDEIALALGFAMVTVFQNAAESFASGRLAPGTLAQLAAEIMIAVARMAPLDTVID